MEWIIQFLIDTIIILILALIIVSLILYLNNKKQRQIIKTKEQIIDLKLGRIYSFIVVILLYFSMFVHFVIFVFRTLIAGDKPGLCFDNGFSGIFGIIMSIIFLTILFMISVPNAITLIQFFKYELGRIIIINKSERTIELYQNGVKTIIKNEDIQVVIYHEKRLFARGDEKLNYIEIRYLMNCVLVVTDLLTTTTNLLSPLEPVFKGVKREYKKRFYNKITCF